MPTTITGSTGIDNVQNNVIVTSKIADGSITPSKTSQPSTLLTAISTTSGTSFDITAIPSWVTRITVMLKGVSTNGTSPIRLQIGSTSIETTGYDSNGSVMGVGNAGSTGGFDRYQTAAADSSNGVYTLVYMGSNTWICSAQYSPGSSSNHGWITGSKTLAGVLDRIRLTTVSGTDTFDAGTINILYE